MGAGGSRLAVADQIRPLDQERKATYRAYLFGSFRVFKGDEVLGHGRQRREKALVLLKWFLLNPGKPSSMEQLIDLGWPDTPSEKAAGSFHVAMHCLRRMLEPDLRPGGESSYVIRSGSNFYRFEAGDSWWTDADKVERLFEQARACDGRGDARRACFYYGRVTAYTGRRFLEDEKARDHWLAPYRRRYEGIYEQVLIRLIQIHWARGELEESVEYAQQLLRLDPHNELAAATVIEADLRLGRQAHAHRELSVFLESLERDLGTAPSSDLLALLDRMAVSFHGGPVL